MTYPLPTRITLGSATSSPSSTVEAVGGSTTPVASTASGSCVVGVASVAAVATPVVASVRTDLQALVVSTGGQVDLGALPTVSTDRTLLCQLLQNFISNGLKYARPDVPPIVTEPHGA